MRRIIFALICLLPIILFLITPSPSGKFILIIGDSLSYPYGIPPKDSWINLLQKRIDAHKSDYKIINFSIPGDKTQQALKRYLWAVQFYKPVITIIELGANDGLYHVPIHSIKSNLALMIQEAKFRKSKVLLLGMRLPLNYEASYREAFRALYPELAQQEQITLVPLLLEHVDNNPQLMQKDKLHPVQEAQATLAETVWLELSKICCN